MVRTVSNGPYLITTTPSLVTCRRVVNQRTGQMCNRLVLAATVTGIDRHVDPATLNDAGELAALMAGRATYHLATQDYLVRRTVEHIRGESVKRPVLADHICARVDPRHVDEAWTAYSVALITSLLGGSVIPAGDDGGPPPF